MGKRKYENGKDNSPKKSKIGITVEIAESDDQPQNETKPGIEAKQRNSQGFDVKHFRKELASKQGQTMVLTQFLQVCLNPDSDVDYMLEYLKCGGNSHEILRQVTQDNKKNLTLATPAFHIFHLIILKVQSSLPHMIAITEEACRYFLNTFMSTVEIMISDSSGPRHRKIVLKLLTSMVTLNSDLGIEVLNQAPLTSKHLQHIVEKPNYKEKDNVRTCFVHFMTSFLVEGHLPLIKALLEKQGLLGLIIPGLLHDEAEAVLMFLNILKTNVIDNVLISKSLKLKTFSQHTLHNMFKIFSWKGPPEISHGDKSESRQAIVSLLSEILVTLFTNHKIGLHFTDNSLGMSDANKNPNLFKALLSLKRPWENEAECEVILDIIYKCPDLHRAIINVIEQSFEPKHSPIWERTVEFTLKLLDKLKPEDVVLKMTNLPPPQIANFVRFVTLPVPLLKFIQANLEKDQTISLYCIKVLVKMLQTLRRYMQILETTESSAVSDLKNRLEYFLPKHMPAPTVVVALIEDVIAGKGKSETNKDYTLPNVSNSNALISLIDLLLLYNDIHPNFFETLEGTIDMKKILDYSVTLSDDNVSLLKFKVVSLWLTLDSSAISLKNPMFKELLRIMLDVYVGDVDSTGVEAKDTLRRFFKNTGIFEADEDEIDILLYTLQHSKWDPPSLIGDVVEYVLENIKELSEYARSQLVNFEIADENSATALEKLFNDLTENRATDDNTFLDNKVPSPFIVGCIQYHQNNKDETKHLKSFLSLYVLNLLHSNYSPELTEVLMGDCKLDARHYVASWTSQPVALPDTTAGKDEPLIKISKSVIENQDLTPTDIFPFLKESTEDKEIVLNEAPYKFDLESRLDSSELLIWAKYLIFCTVRLTDMSQLTHERQKKITDYFQCIIAIGRRQHKVDVCRTIISNLLKNPHVLKIYKPLDLNKGDVSLLATKFILQVITDNKDIITYLNSKLKVLNSYKQKNYNEIVKAFIKINKRKNVNCDHTIDVLETVGLADEDDIRIFNQIFGTEAVNCVRDDKEPSLVLELLRNLIDKYSKTVALELQPQILRKCIKLYTELLTNKEINANLTKLEDSLAKYYENKPHQVNTVSVDLFKKFFVANTVRKTTSHFAYVLLKNNLKLCNTFKEQVLRPEILSLRELALPLGSAIINHKSFLLENQQLLLDYYNEYKSNINKMLEKPHKAGQVYATNWKFIRKLVLECMDSQECAKLFSKTHKFETVETGHVNLMQAVFLKLCTSGSVKNDHLINYFLTMLHLITIALKEGKDAIIVNETISNTYRVVQICKTVQELNVQQKDEFKKVTENALWQNFCKAVLKDSLKVKTADQGITAGPQLLCLLTHLVKLFYSYQHDDISSLFDMVTSHSEFLNVMLSYYSSEIKSRLVEFLYTLIVMNKSVMKTQQIPVYLSSYHATRSPCDRLILAILYHYESSGLPVNEYKPYVWGESGANYYAVRKSRSSSLWAHPTANQVLSLFEKDIIERTVRNFPVTQKLDYLYEIPCNIDGVDPSCLRSILDDMSKDNVFKSTTAKDIEGAVKSLELKAKYTVAMERLKGSDVNQSHKIPDEGIYDPLRRSEVINVPHKVSNEGIYDPLKRSEVVNVSHTPSDEGIYDPLFVIPLLSHLLAAGSAVSCFRVVRSGLAALPVAALGARCPRLRAAAYHVLHRFCMLLETETRHKNDKLFLNDFISTLRHSLASASNNAEAENTKADLTKADLTNPRLPAISALYLARALMASTAPFDPLYKPVNNFLIAKQFVDLTVVPDFLTLFHDCDVESADRRNWILDVIHDGVKTTTDVNVVFKTMCIKMILDYYSSVLSDKRTKEKILKVVASLIAVPRAFEILVEGYGLISWLHAVARQMRKNDKSLAMAVLNIIRNIMYSMKLNTLTRNLARSDARPKPNGFPDLKINKDIESEILVILHDSFRNIAGLEEDDIAPYLKVYNSISRNTIKSMSKNHVFNVVSAVGTLRNGECVALLKKALSANDANLLKSIVVEVSSKSDSLLNELILLVKAYLL